MTIEEAPPNGWLVVCIATGTYVIAHSQQGLETVLSSVLRESEEKARAMDYAGPIEGRFPIQVFELGREMSWAMRYQLYQLEPMPAEDGDPQEGSGSDRSGSE